ncbi:MAG: hypothetical protein KJ053_03585 [Dehalococcoidia bacterium]|nr:hypothetical protein [Dehalococcoidia bacterium]
MKRPLIVGLVLVSAVLAALPATFFSMMPGTGRLDRTASAAGSVPPGPPLVLYGAAPGVAGGTSVTITNNANGAYCGRGTVVSDGGSTYYVVDVYASSQAPGCGTPGASLSLALYFAPSTPTSGGRTATANVTWNVGSAKVDVTPGSPLPIAGYAPVTTRDGLYY